jgi:putative flippase GtrA
MLQGLIQNQQFSGRFIRFFVVGGFSYIINVLTFWFLIHVLNTSAAFSIAFVVSVMVHYTLNRFWALPSKRSDLAKQLLEYLGTTVLSYVMSFTVFNLCHFLLGFTPLWSQVCAQPPSTLIVFLILNFRVFKNK